MFCGRRRAEGEGREGGSGREEEGGEGVSGRRRLVHLATP